MMPILGGKTARSQSEGGAVSGEGGGPRQAASGPGHFLWGGAELGLMHRQDMVFMRNTHSDHYSESSLKRDKGRNKKTS